MTHLLLFLGVSALVIVTPGQDTALTIRNALLGGRRVGVLTAIGVAAGQLVWAVLTAVGVASVLQAHQGALNLLRWAGAAYLCYLGGRALWSAWRAHDLPPVGAGPRRRGGAGFRQGLLSNLANPKMAVFFLSLLPQFTGSRPTFAALVSLGGAFAVLTFGWLSLYALVVDRVRNVLLRKRVRRVMDSVTGAVLLALGVRVAAETG